jgi:hemerythrin
MAYFEWGPDLSVGVESLDQDHRKMIGLVNDLHSATQQGEGRAVAGQIIEQLMAYAREHFQREEACLERGGYPGLAKHRAEHAALLRQVLALRQQYECGQVTVAAKASALLREWLSVHIMSHDKAYADFLQRPAAGRGELKPGAGSP